MGIESRNYFSGTSNVVLPVPNKSFFPKEYQNQTRLAYYASLFNSVEINSSFYKIPQHSTVRKWAESVPSYFRFTFKLWKEITHNKEHLIDPAAIRMFAESIAGVGEKKGCILVQFPPSFTSDPSYLDRLLQNLQDFNPDRSWKIAVEFRNRSWYQDLVYEIVEAAGAAVVLHDLPSSATPFRETESELMYLRFHGPNGGYRGSYTADFLSEYAGYIGDWAKSGKTVFAYFNNTMGAAVNNLITLNSYLDELERGD